MATVHYVAYGSNLHPLRLTQRVPSARALGVVEMPGFQLAFHKRSIDGSGKCLMYSEQGKRQKAYGLLYAIDAEEKKSLDILEGCGKGYLEQQVQFSLEGQTYTPFLYTAQSTHIDPGLVPYHWYKQLVIAGARYHGFPRAYMEAIAAIPSMSDPDATRSRENERLLEQIRQV